jgi:hypothetical protein
VTSQRASVGLLAVSTIGTGLFGLAQPARLGAMIGADETAARARGIRDLTNGLALGAAILAGRDARPALAARAMFGVTDAVRYGRNDKRVLVSTLGFAALAGLAWVRAGRGA